MKYPIVAYGDPVLKKVAEEIDENYPNLDKLIEDMFETMHESNGVGLAAPQIGKSIRLFIVDASPFAEDEEYAKENLEDFVRVFINPVIFDENGKEWVFEEGCLSIPNIREEVKRKPKLTIEYYDENWDLYEEELEGIAARVVQHEYDHIEGVLFTDRISPMRKALLKGKLSDITKGDITVGYRMKFPKRK